ncbi:hypothetical protein [Sphingomonas sp. IC-56]|uniref:hypothetical protein n=1 Tax=Sphingomonas sp. IC-56 TaxID=2898529 RepID=UPI001E44B85B|nr:hypothetical protein [Sphingomonas sp. IC-56]
MHFDIELVRAVDDTRLGWPGTRQLQEGSRLGGNHEYVDLRYISWADAIAVAREEREISDRIGRADDPDDEWTVIQDELEDDPGLLVLLDLGVASTVAALSAAGCITISSCNGGAHGDHHHERYPLVAFYARRQHVPLLLSAAELAGVGIENDPDGALVVYADALDRMSAFAAALLADRARYEAL